MRFWLVLAICCLTAPSVAATEVQFTPQAEQDRGRYPWLQRVTPILQHVSRLRQLPIKHPVTVTTLNQQQLQQELQKRIKTDLKPEQLESEQALYHMWQLLRPEQKLETMILELYSNQIGGFYDPDTRYMYLIKDIPLGRLDMDMLLAHELTHALQDQHYQLKPFLESQKHNDDTRMAYQALIEGDATETANQYMVAYLSKNTDFLGIFESLGTLFRMQDQFRKLQQVPSFFKNIMMFPYISGASFVQTIRLAGLSWSDIYRHPPTGTAYILHPEHYLSKALIHDSDLNTVSFVPHKRLGHNVLGELAFLELFTQQLNQPEASQAAKGWQGDRYELYRTAKGYLFTLKTHWATTTDAQEFYHAYQVITDQRYGNWKQNQQVDRLTWEGPHQERVWLALKDKHVMVIEAPIDITVGVWQQLQKSLAH